MLDCFQHYLDSLRGREWAPLWGRECHLDFLWGGREWAPLWGREWGHSSAQKGFCIAGMEYQHSSPADHFCRKQIGGRNSRSIRLVAWNPYGLCKKKSTGTYRTTRWVRGRPGAYVVTGHSFKAKTTAICFLMHFPLKKGPISSWRF
jgi:hypothetical protein